MAAENAEYERVLGELKTVCDDILDLCGQMNLDKIKNDLQIVSHKYQDQMQRLNKFEESYSEAMSALEEERKENVKLNIQLTQAKTDLSDASQAQTEGLKKLEAEIEKSDAEVKRVEEQNELIRQLDTKKNEINNLTHMLTTANSQLMEMNREISELRALLPEEGGAPSVISRGAFANGGLDGGMPLVPVVSLVPVVTYVDAESLAHAVSHTDPEIIPAIMPPPVVNRKYTEGEIEKLLDTIANNVYLNGDVAPKFKSPFTGNNGLVLTPDNFKKGIKDFPGSPLATFNSTGKFTNLLRLHSSWTSGPYKNTAKQYLRSLNI